MSDILHRLLEIEEEARGIVELARQEAARTVEQARAEARKMIQQATEAARRESQELKRKQREEAEMRKQKAVEEARQGAPSVQTVDSRRISEAVELVTRAVAHGLAEEERPG